MGAGFYRDLRAILLAHGCVLVRQGKGSHEFWQSPITQARFPVSVTVTSKPMANSILKQAGIRERI